MGEARACCSARPLQATRATTGTGSLGRNLRDLGDLNLLLSSFDSSLCGSISLLVHTFQLERLVSGQNLRVKTHGKQPFRPHGYGHDSGCYVSIKRGLGNYKKERISITPPNGSRCGHDLHLLQISGS